MKRVILLLLFITSFSACKKTIPESQVKSLSGKDYKSLNDGVFSESDISLVKDFLVGQSVVIDQWVSAPGGLIFTIKNGDNPYGQELFFYNEASRKWRVVADIVQEPYEGSMPMGLKVLGNTLYFTAQTKEHGREFYSLDLSGSWQWNRLSDINAGDVDSVFIYWEGDRGKLEFEAVDNSGVKLYALGNYHNGVNYVPSLMEYDVSSNTAIHLATSSVVTNFKKIYNAGGVIFGITNAGDIFQVSATPDLDLINTVANTRNYNHIGADFYFTSGQTIYKVSGKALSSSAQLSEIREMIALGTNLYAVMNGDLYSVTTTLTSTLISMNDDQNYSAQVKNLTAVQEKLCLTALDDTLNGSGRFLFCSKGSSVSSKSSFQSYDFDATNGGENKIGKIVETSTGIAVAATTSDGSSVFTFVIDASFSTLGLTSPIQVMPYRPKLYGYIEKNYGQFLSFSNTIMAQDEFDWLQSYHSSLTSEGTDLRYAYEDPSGGATNGSSYIKPKFMAANMLIGDYIGNIKSFWSLDLDSKVVTVFELGSILSEPLEHNGKYYFVTSYKMLKEIVEYNPATNSARLLHPCGQTPDGFSGYTPNFCFPGDNTFAGDIKLHQFVGDNIYYTASYHDGQSPPMETGYNIWTINVTDTTPLAKEFEYTFDMGSIDNVEFVGADSGNIYLYDHADTTFYMDHGTNPTNVFGGVSSGLDIDNFILKNGYIFIVASFDNVIRAHKLSDLNNSIEFTPQNDSNLKMELINNEIFFTSDGSIEKVVYNGSGVPSVQDIASTVNEVFTINDLFYTINSNGGLETYSPTGSLLETYPNVLSDNSNYDCDSTFFDIYELNDHAIVFYCDDWNSVTEGPAVYSKKNQKSYVLSTYGVQFNTVRDRVFPVNFNNDNLVVYTEHYNQWCPPESSPCSFTQFSYDFNQGRLIEIDNNTGMINFAAIDNEQRNVSQLSPGVYFSCMDGNPEILNYSVSPASNYQIQDTFCVDDHDINAIVNGNEAYVPLLRGVSSESVGIELYGIQL